MTMYIHGSIVTSYGIASNNRGESSGNNSRLQFVDWKGENHSTVSSESKRYALRCMMENAGIPMNRHHAVSKRGENTVIEWHDPTFSQSETLHPDSDFFGFMLAEKVDQETKDAEAEVAPKDKTKANLTRTSRLSFNRSISLDPYSNDQISNNFAATGASPYAVSHKTRKKNNAPTPVPYSCEFHATRYQFPFSLEPGSVINTQYIPDVIRMICNLYKVGGNHARYFFDFSAESLFLRLTHQPAHRMSYCFKHSDDFSVVAPNILDTVAAGDIIAEELFVGGVIANTDLGKSLKKLGATVDTSINGCVEEMLKRLGGSRN